MMAAAKKASLEQQLLAEENGIIENEILAKDMNEAIELSKKDDGGQALTEQELLNQVKQ